MVEVLKQTIAAGSNAVSEESLAHAYNIYDEETGFGTEQKKSSDDLEYSIPVFGCSANDVCGIKTYRIDFEAIHNSAPHKEEQRIEEDLDAILERDEVEASKRITERIDTAFALLKAHTTPIAKDNKEFSLNEFQEYSTTNANVIVKAGAYSVDN